jgi:glutamyl-tRNA reductase
MDLVQVGADPHVAPLALRERLALPLERAAAVAAAVRQSLDAAEALVVSTCNRTELYVVGGEGDVAVRALTALLAAIPGAPSPDAGGFVLRRGEAAARHLYRVTAGLESAILGETEIQGQVRDAHAAATQAGAAGPVLDRLVRGAVHAGKRARSETGVSEGVISHGSAAAQVARRVFGTLAEREVLLVGAGHVATQAARALADLGGRRFTILNRGRERAAEAAAVLPEATVEPLERLPAHLASAHVLVLAADGAPLSAAAVSDALARRRDPLLVLDLCVPRAAERAVGDLPGVFLYDLEALEGLVAGALAARRESVPRVEAILDEEFARLGEWLRALRAAPVLRSLSEWADDLRRAELEHLPESLTPEQKEAVDALTRRLVAKLLGRPAARVAEGARAEDPSLPTPEALKHLFGLGEPPRP